MIVHVRRLPPTLAQRQAVRRQRRTAAATATNLACLTATLWLATIPSAWLWASGIGFLVTAAPAYLGLADPKAGEKT